MNPSGFHGMSCEGFVDVAHVLMSFKVETCTR